MRWQRGTSDADTEDRRGAGGGGMRMGGGGGMKIGLGGLILLGILSVVFKQDFFALLSEVAVENLADRFYREQFQFARARGRTVTIIRCGSHLALC